jgi:hypothetical protein
MNIGKLSENLRLRDTHTQNLRILLQCSKCPEYGLGIKFKLSGTHVVAEYTHLKTKNGSSITNTTKPENLENLNVIGELPEPYIIILGVTIQKINFFLNNKITDVHYLSASDKRVKGFLFNS